MRTKILLYFICIFVISSTVFVGNTRAKNLSEEEQLILVGTGAFSDGFYDIAEKEFEIFVKAYGNHKRIYDIYYLFGKTLLMKGKYKEARAAFLRIINENKDF